MAFVVPAVAAVVTLDSVKGTWSCSWTPASTTAQDSVTIELKVDSGRLTGRFVSPTPAEFTKATLTPQTGVLTIEAVDEKAGKHYKLDGKIQGNRVSGTFNTDGKTGPFELVKWTFFG